MNCKVCGCELGALKMRTIVEGDDSPNTVTRVYIEHDMACKNKHCTNFNVVAETQRDEVKIG